MLKMALYFVVVIRLSCLVYANITLASASSLSATFNKY